MTDTPLERALAKRFGDIPTCPADLAQNDALSGLAARGSCRSFTPQQPSLDTIRTLCATALAAPSKSDLQQRDILIVDDPERTQALKDLLGAQEWIAGAPRLLLFLANNRRQRLVQTLHDQPFPNDHLDAFFNASVDAGIALAFFIAAAEAAGLSCCPISTIRNHLADVSEMFALPDHVFPVAALAIGTSAHDAPRITPRLSLQSTVSVDVFRDTTPQDIRAYDARRQAQAAPGTDTPDWSRAKAKMYAEPQRQDFADFIRSIGFRLD